MKKESRHLLIVTAMAFTVAALSGYTLAVRPKALAVARYQEEVSRLRNELVQQTELVEVWKRIHVGDTERQQELERQNRELRTKINLVNNDLLRPTNSPDSGVVVDLSRPTWKNRLSGPGER